MKKALMSKIDGEFQKLKTLIENSTISVENKKQTFRYIQKIRKTYTLNEQKYNDIDDVKKSLYGILRNDEFITRHVIGNKESYQKYKRIKEYIIGLLQQL